MNDDMTGRTVIFRHSRSADSGSLIPILNDGGAPPVTVVNTYWDDITAFDPLAPALLIVLGGPPGVYQSDIYPFLKTEMRILEARMKADLPVLGICLGAQLMAAALGARVFKGAQGREIGWHPLRLSAHGAQTPARHFAPESTYMMQWHGDAFDLPAGATLLASGDLYPHQIFSYGKNAIGFQSHPEVTPESLADWYVDAAGSFAAGDLDIVRLRTDTLQHGEKLVTQMRAFMADWLAQTGVVGERKRAHA